MRNCQEENKRKNRRRRFLPHLNEGVSAPKNDDAVKFIIAKTPQNYYHYGQTGTAVQAPATPAPSSENIAMDKKTVREMQTKLSALGYNVGTPDGVAGKKTETAVRQFQQANGLQVTGLFNPATIQTIRAAH